MELQEIDVFIENNGEVKIEVRGAKGPHCLLLTSELEKILGGQVIKRDLTSEYSEQSAQDELTNNLQQKQTL